MHKKTKYMELLWAEEKTQTMSKALKAKHYVLSDTFDRSIKILIRGLILPILHF